MSAACKETLERIRAEARAALLDPALRKGRPHLAALSLAILKTAQGQPMRQARRAPK